MHPLIETHLDTINDLCRKFDVERLHAFGSITSKGHFSDISDVDLLVKFKKIPFDRYTDNYFQLHDLLEKIFNRKVDLVTEKSLSNPYFIKAVNETRTLIYEE